MQRSQDEPLEKKAKKSDLAFPIPTFLDDLTTALAAALETNKVTHSSTVVERILRLGIALTGACTQGQSQASAGRFLPQCQSECRPLQISECDR